MIEVEDDCPLPLIWDTKLENEDNTPCLRPNEVKKIINSYLKS